mgnify:CR=1 FL=1
MLHPNQLDVNDQILFFEILVLDDASTDKQCSSENKKINALDHCSYLENEKNIGRTATRNILAKKAKYDWLLFLDADVIPLNTAISNVAYTMTLGSQNAANSTGTNILIRIALASGQTISDLQIGTAT